MGGLVLWLIVVIPFAVIIVAAIGGCLSPVYKAPANILSSPSFSLIGRRLRHRYHSRFHLLPHSRQGHLRLPSDVNITTTHNPHPSPSQSAAIELTSMSPGGPSVATRTPAANRPRRRSPVDEEIALEVLELQNTDLLRRHRERMAALQQLEGFLPPQTTAPEWEEVKTETPPPAYLRYSLSAPVGPVGHVYHHHRHYHNHTHLYRRSSTGPWRGGRSSHASNFRAQAAPPQEGGIRREAGIPSAAVDETVAYITPSPHHTPFPPPSTDVTVPWPGPLVASRRSSGALENWWASTHRISSAEPPQIDLEIDSGPEFQIDLERTMAGDLEVEEVPVVLLRSPSPVWFGPRGSGVLRGRGKGKGKAAEKPGRGGEG
ncbi:hypothetical protein BDZ91DRAFT_797128 [Kalaharituber pfeilii]|nr:hypothetical protein BDZ91DRAFT_797128 [Kalaharituber pfeilii]